MPSSLKTYFRHSVLLLVVLFALQPLHAQDAQTTRTYNEVRHVPDSVVKKMQNDRDFRYANDSSYWVEEKPKTSFLDRLIRAIGNSQLLLVLLYIFLAVVIIFVIYQVMVANNFFIFSRGKHKRGAGQEENMDQTIEDFDERIRAAIESKNYREAIRFMYLKTLKILSDSHFITMHAKSTNQDYIKQMYQHGGGGQFRQLTRIYEYVWYGEFDPSESQFDKIRTNFNQFNPKS